MAFKLQNSSSTLLLWYKFVSLPNLLLSNLLNVQGYHLPTSYYKPWSLLKSLLIHH